MNQTRPDAFDPMSSAVLSLSLEYAGEAFFGVQKQPDRRTVVGELERHLSSMVAHPVEVMVAGRTDAGVHATRQVASFVSHTSRPDSAFLYGVNAHLAPCLSIRSVVRMPQTFHPRYAAIARRYVYVLYRRPRLPVHWRAKASLLRSDVDLSRMEAAARLLIGHHDFSAFRAAGCQSHSPYRDVREIAFYERGDFILVSIEANAFLYRMVRKMVHSLCQVGSGRWSLDQFIEIFEARQGSRTTPMGPEGLYLTDVVYPDCYDQANRRQLCWLEEWMRGGTR